MSDRALPTFDSTSKQLEIEYHARVFEASGFTKNLIRKTLTRTHTQKSHKQHSGDVASGMKNPGSNLDSQ